MDGRHLGRVGCWVCGLLLVLLAGWLALMAVQARAFSPSFGPRDFVVYVSRADWVHGAVYLNAMAFTALAVALFALLNLRFRASHPMLTAISGGFVPVYGAMNITVYGSQLTAAPSFARRALALDDEPALLQLALLYKPDGVLQ